LTTTATATATSTTTATAIATESTVEKESSSGGGAVEDFLRRFHNMHHAEISHGDVLMDVSDVIYRGNRSSKGNAYSHDNGKQE
jgi:hypothetical protein